MGAVLLRSLSASVIVVATAGGVSVRVSPSVGATSTTFVVSFVNPVRTGVTGSTRLSEMLTATSRSPASSCLRQASATVPAAPKGQRVRVVLDPEKLGGIWCVGSYGGTVTELQTAVCPHGIACPTYVRFLGTVTRFSLTVRARSSGDRMPPSFAGLERAFACTPGPQRPGETTPYTLSWQAASDDATPAAEIVYDVYYSTASGGEDFAHPSWTTPPGVTTFHTPGLPSHGQAYFVVRARDAAGNEDRNVREQRGVDPCY